MITRMPTNTDKPISGILAAYRSLSDLNLPYYLMYSTIGLSQVWELHAFMNLNLDYSQVYTKFKYGF